MRTKNALATFALLSAASAIPSLHAEFVYNNSTGDLNTRLSAGTYEIADEIILGGTGRLATQVDLQYYAQGLSGGETLTVRFYHNDGGTYSNGGPQYQLPGTLFYTSNPLSIANTLRNTIVLQDSSGNGALPDNMILPDRFTVSVQFSGITAGENVGVDLYNAPTIGLSESDYWLNDVGNGGWQPRTNATTPLNFGMRVQAVPEPSVWVLSIAGGLCGLFLIGRRSNKR